VSGDQFGHRLCRTTFHGHENDVDTCKGNSRVYGQFQVCGVQQAFATIEINEL
jgi:hypothetical protein